MKHTKGNWEPFIHKYPTKPREIYAGVGIADERPEGIYWTMICDMILPKTDKQYIKEHEEIKANAQLIASAPELLEALKVAVRWIDSEIMVDDNDVTKNMKEAIKKAES